MAVPHNVQLLMDLSSHLVHDLRTPVNAIMGYAGLLIEDAPDDAELRRRAEPVRAIGERLNTLIGGLPRTGPFPAGWVQSLDAPLAQLEQALVTLKDWPGAAQDDVRTIETARDRLLALLASLSEVATPVASVEAKRPTALPAAPQPAAGGASTILVVDDNEMNRNMLSRRLQQLGHQVEQAGDGDTALRMLRRRSYDLLLLDIIMPGLDGYEVLEVLRSDPELSALPVLVISALTEMASVARCIELGAVDFLPKHVDTVVLRARVSRSIEQKCTRDRERSYLNDVAVLTAAAASVRDGLAVDETAIGQVAGRGDDLGELARAFGRMVQEINQREAALRAQLAEVQRLEVDATSRAQAVSEITDSEYFQQLRAKAQLLRQRNV